jgi:hypothetical protein
MGTGTRAALCEGKNAPDYDPNRASGEQHDEVDAHYAA